MGRLARRSELVCTLRSGAEGGPFRAVGVGRCGLKVRAPLKGRVSAEAESAKPSGEPSVIRHSRKRSQRLLVHQPLLLQHAGGAIIERAPVECVACQAEVAQTRGVQKACDAVD